MVQNMTHTEAEIQQMSNLLQDLESSMNNTKQRQEEVRTETVPTVSTVSLHTPVKNMYIAAVLSSNDNPQAKGGLQWGVVKDSARSLPEACGWLLKAPK